MEKVAQGFKDKGVVFYMLYTREPHAGMKNPKYDFSDKKQTQTAEERVDYAAEMIQKYSQERPVLIDTFGPDCLQQKIGGGMPNSLILFDKEGKVALWQNWSHPGQLQIKLEEMTGYQLPKELSVKEQEFKTPGMSKSGQPDYLEGASTKTPPAAIPTKKL